MLIDNLDVSTLGAIQVLRNTKGGGCTGLSAFQGNSVVYGSTLITLRVGGWVGGVKFPGKKRYVTLEGDSRSETK